MVDPQDRERVLISQRGRRVDDRVKACIGKVPAARGSAGLRAWFGSERVWPARPRRGGRAPPARRRRQGDTSARRKGGGWRVFEASGLS